MYRDSIKVDLVFKHNPSIFAKRNADVIGNISLPLGSTMSAVTRMTTGNEKMLKFLMPSVINVLPTDQSWYDKVANYWHSFTLSVPVGGVSLEIGFDYDINDRDRADYIRELVSKDKTITNDKTLRDYLLSHTKEIPELDRYLYARPINVKDYLTYVYCLGHKHVSNTVDTVDKSSDIRFTLIDQRTIIEQRRSNHDVSINAMKKYLEILANRETVRDMLYVLGHDASQFIDIDADATLKNMVDTQPKKFLDTANDKTLTTRARIERYIIRGVLKRLNNSEIIVDANDPSVVVGSTIDEAIVFFNAESADKNNKVTEFKARYAALNKK